MNVSSQEEFNNMIKGVLISEDEIRAEIAKAGKLIDSFYDGSPVLLVSVLKGAFVFLADLVRAVSVPCEVDFMEAKSYFDATQSSGSVAVTRDLRQNITGRDVVIVEDIIDTGRTLSEIVKLLRARSPRSLRIVTLLDKPSRRVTELNADYSLFTIPDKFVIGYGLDYGELFRNLPYIGEFNEDFCK
ncbi:MAG: hypoxanthine phosphoribosyltransferase [Ruminococcus sp.]|nr:hypoxanthine phosphoribosyltransferase [Ruminococcus sp.]